MDEVIQSAVMSSPSPSGEPHAQPVLQNHRLPLYPRPGFSRVRILRSQICHSDRRVLAGTKSSSVHEQPIVLGHEAVGEVEISSRLAKGTLVLILPHTKQFSTTPQHLGFHLNGVFTDRMDFPEEVLYPLPPLPEEPKAANRFLDLMVNAEPLACVLRAHAIGPQRPPEHLLIFGAGPIGVLHALASRRLWPRARITLCEPQEARRLLAAELVNLNAEIVSFPREGELYDRAILATSNPKAVVEAVQFISSGGEINLFSGLDRLPSDPRFLLQGHDLETLHRMEKTVLVDFSGKSVLLWGSSGYHLEDVDRAVQTLQRDFEEDHYYGQVATARIDGIASPLAHGLRCDEPPHDFGEPALVALLRPSALGNSVFYRYLKTFIRHTDDGFVDTK